MSGCERGSEEERAAAAAAAAASKRINQSCCCTASTLRRRAVAPLTVDGWLLQLDLESNGIELSRMEPNGVERSRVERMIRKDGKNGRTGAVGDR